MSDIRSFVTSRLGSDAASKLSNIRRGGDNNSKGNTFESFVRVAKICEFAARTNDLSDIMVTSQEVAYVDDLCFRQHKEGMKHNDQIKNSSGSAAAWNKDMEWRFETQQQIDSEFHNMSTSHQILLVACPDRARLNNNAIPTELTELSKRFQNLKVHVKDFL